MRSTPLRDCGRRPGDIRIHDHRFVRPARVPRPLPMTDRRATAMRACGRDLKQIDADEAPATSRVKASIRAAQDAARRARLRVTRHPARGQHGPSDDA